jgi:hypothetical protein
MNPRGSALLEIAPTFSPGRQPVPADLKYENLSALQLIMEAVCDVLF